MRERERGQLMIVVALGMVAFLGFAAVTVDLGYAYAQRRFAQNAADAATMAAVRMIRVSDPSTTQASAIYNEMVRVAGMNGNAQLDSANTEFLDINGGSLGPAASYALSLQNVAGVRVRTRITYNTFFAGIIGVNTLTSAGTAASMSMGVASVAGTGIRPMAVPNGTYTPGTTYTIWDSDHEASGNAGWLDFNGGNNSTPELAGWLMNGFASSPTNPFTYYGGGSTPGAEQSSTSLPFPSWIQGDPGNRSAVSDEVEDLVGDVITIMLYDSLYEERGGSNVKYRVVGMLQFRITSVDMTGNPKIMRGEFIRSVVPDSPSGSYSTGMLSTVRLVPPSVPTSLPSPTSAPVLSPTATSVGWPTNTPTPEGPTATPSATPEGPTATPTATGAATATLAPTMTPTPSRTPTPTATPTPPSAPSSLSVSEDGQYAMNLSWTDNSVNEDGFYVERSLDGTSGWTQVGSTGGNVATFHDTGLTNNTRYHYRIRAFNSGGNSGYSNVDDDKTDN